MTTYYVSNDGDDEAAGTSTETAWATLEKCHDFGFSFAAGDALLFRRGDTFYGQFDWVRSGTEALPVKIGAYGIGAKPIISARWSNLVWTPTGVNGTYSAPMPHGTYASLAFSGATRYTAVLPGELDLTDPVDIETYLDGLTSEQYGPVDLRAAAKGETIYVKPLDGEDPVLAIFGAQGIFVRNFTAWATVEDIVFRYGGSGLHTEGLSYGTIQNCEAYDICGIGIKNITCANTTVQGCVTDRTYGYGVYWQASRDCVTRKNSFSRSGYYVLGHAPGGDKSTMGSHTSSNMLFEYNTCVNPRHGMLDLYLSYGDVARFNTCVGCGSGGVTLWGGGVRFYENILVVTSYNTSYGLTAGVAPPVSFGTKPIFVGNNIFWDTAYFGIKYVAASYTNYVGVVIRNNLIVSRNGYLGYYTDVVDADSIWYWDNRDTPAPAWRHDDDFITDFKEFQLARRADTTPGRDQNSRYQDPGLGVRPTLEELRAWLNQHRDAMGVRPAQAHSQFETNQPQLAVSAVVRTARE